MSYLWSPTVDIKFHFLIPSKEEYSESPTVGEGVDTYLLGLWGFSQGLRNYTNTPKEWMFTDRSVFSTPFSSPE